MLNSENIKRQYLKNIDAKHTPPYLLEVQKNAYEWFFREGLRELFDEINPIKDIIGRDFELFFLDYALDEPKFDENTARLKNLTFESSLKVRCKLVNKKTGEIKEQDVYLGDFPLMTNHGTFIINGIERVVVSQLVRSAGVFFTTDIVRGRKYYGAKIIPNRGAWLEISTDQHNVLWVKIDRKRKVAVTSLLQAFGMNTAEIKDTFKDVDNDSDINYIDATLKKDLSRTQEDALIEVYKRIRPGDLATSDNAKSLIFATFFNFERYDFSRVGRYKINKKFDFKFPNTPEHRVLKMEDLVAIISEIIRLNISQTEADDIDHLSNRRIRAVGELLQTKLRVGLARMKRIIKDKMSTLNVESIAPVQLINSRPITSVIREFFMSSPLSQFMDQVNPLAELEHKRRLSVMGPGGLQRERAGFEVRDVHRTHYGKICPIESPEGATIGLVGHMALYARVNEYGFLETPYIKVYRNLESDSVLLPGKILNENIKGIGNVGDKITKEMFKKISALKSRKIKIKSYVSDEVDFLTSSEEEKYIISINYNLVEDNYFKKDFVEARIRGEAGNANVEDIDYMDISTNQIVGVSASLIPFLEHTDAHRALMGSNMQRQAVPCIKPESPVVGTGLEGSVAKDSGQVYLAPVDADVMEADACHIKLLGKDKQVYSYTIRKFARSNQGTCINQRLLVKTGDKVKKGDVLVDGTSVSNGELALGQNLTVAFMCWEGGNYEDAILLSERVVEADRYTSIHIDTKVIDIRETKIGPEIITRDIPNISEDKLKNLDEEGVIRLGAEVGPGDILVGKITPKGETELSAEERLLRAIFGDKAKDVRDSSLRLEHGERGKIVDIKIFSREKGDKLQSGVMKSIEVSIATLRKIQVGDKMAGRYGNKGVISRIVKVEDMPYLADGTPVDILLNPLGVVSRMNLGQIFEVHLGLAATALGMKIATPVFNGVEKDEVAAYLKKAGYPENGKIQLFDGRNGEEFKEKTTVGIMYMLKLNHLVEDKIHQRSIGPYSLVTQQPLGGRAQFGGQRLGEMEVWALEAYGASHILQEMLTIKSDDVIGRSKAYESIIRGEAIQKLDVPESFNVLVREMKGLCLDVQLLKKDEDKNFQDVSELFFDDAKLTDIANRKVLNFDGIKLSVASPEIIKGWSSGEVTKPETINYRTQKPERDGLLCEKIFGPVKDWECACGKYRKIRYKGIVCDKCGVEVTKSIVRRSKFGHIDLCVPVSHIWFLKGIPSKVGLLLDLTGQTLEKVVYFADFIITSVNEELKGEIVERLNNEYKGRKKSIDNEMKQKLSQVKTIAEKTGKKVEDVTIEIEKELESQLDSLKQEFEETKTELSDLKVKKVLNEEKYRRLSIKFGYLFEAHIGAEAIRRLLENIDLEKLYKELEEQLPTVSQLNKKRLLNRIQLVDNLTRNKIRPEWMILTTIPVLPPNLRPIVQLDGGRFASSDLNDLYRRIINRNNRLKRLIAINAPEVICRNEKRMLQEAVDALIDNGARKSKMATASTGQRRPLKSIADSLKGKQGRFRQNLLGKRVDYSGRSVIVVGPKLKIYQCGLPKIMALELFKPFVISQLIRREYVYNIRAASKLIEQGTKEVWDILEEVALNSYVLLNRAPTLHRLGMQAFKPVLIDGKAIQLHPLVCEAFNADFDGDQMAVYVPLSEEALYEASEIMLSKNNLLKPANGEPVNVPRMDMVLGAYYLTNLKDKEKYEKSVSRIFMSYDELVSAYNMKVINLQEKVSFVDEEGKIITTILGRAILNRVIPMGIRNYEIAFDKKVIHKTISASLSKYGFEKTAELLDGFKDLTFGYVTASGISLGLGDLPDITNQKKEHIEKARQEVDKIKDQFEMGFLTDQERHRKVIELWSKVKDEVSAIGENSFDKLSPFYIMVKSGARGSNAQLNQMVSMKGTVISPSGGIIELPIRHSLQEGFDSLEYFISTHGARKGLTDTALKTSSAGYLTRRLVDVAQDVIIGKEDCGDSEGVLITKEECKEIGEGIDVRIFGRYILEDVVDREKNKVIVKKDEIISREVAKEIATNENINSVRVRSVLACKCDRGVCSKCYGYDLGRNTVVKNGTPVGIIAAQSIGEPATQLVLRTFHSGGISGSDITQGLPRVEEIFEARSVKKKAFLAEYDGKIVISESEGKEKDKVITLSYKNKESEDYEIVKGMDVVVKDGDKVKPGETLAKAFEKKINAKNKGLVKIANDRISVIYEKEDEKEYVIPFGYTILVKNNTVISKGDSLTDGSIDLYELYELKGQKSVELYVLKEIQHVYTSQGQDLNDKHIEIIVRQMFSKMRILNPGESKFIRGDITSLGKFNLINENLKKEGKKAARGMLLLMGITKVSEFSDSWLSAASFQETTKALVNASISGEIDELVGLKENVIIGKLIPVGTGLDKDLLKNIRHETMRAALTEVPNIIINMEEQIGL